MYYGLVYISNDGKQLALARSRGGDLDVWDRELYAIRIAAQRQRGFGFRVRVVPLPYAGPFSYPPAPTGAKPKRYPSW